MATAVQKFHEEEAIGKTYDWQVAKRLLRYLKPYVRLLFPALLLTLLLNLALFRAFPHQSPKRVAARCGFFLALLIGLEEFSQQYFASRTFDWVDLLFSYLGVLFFSWVAVKITRQGELPHQKPF